MSGTLIESEHIAEGMQKFDILIVGGGGAVLRYGDFDGDLWISGQSGALIQDIPACAELVRNIVAQAKTVRDKIAG